MFFSTSHYKPYKTLWDTLQVLNEGSEGVKQSKINTLAKEYELFCMKHGETVASMHKRCVHMIKKLENLGNTISNQDCANKVLRLCAGK